MVRNASRVLKIGVHLPFDPDFDVRIGTFNPKMFHPAYSRVPVFYAFFQKVRVINTGDSSYSGLVFGYLLLSF